MTTGVEQLFCHRFQLKFDCILYLICPVRVRHQGISIDKLQHRNHQPCNIIIA
jgi:hypothetical protein